MSKFVKEISEESFDEEVGKGVVLAYFFATWCGPCKNQIGPLEEKAENTKNISFIKLDVDKSQQVAHAHNVTAMPTLIIFKDGIEIDRHVGVADSDKIQELINKATA